MSIKNPTNSLAGDTSDLNRAHEARLRFGFVDQSSSCVKQGGDGVFRITTSSHLISFGAPKKSYLLEFFGFSPSYKISSKLARHDAFKRMCQIHILDLLAVSIAACITAYAFTTVKPTDISRQYSQIKSSIIVFVRGTNPLPNFAIAKQFAAHFDPHSYAGWMTPGPITPRPYPTPLNAFSVDSTFNSTVNQASSLTSGLYGNVVNEKKLTKIEKQDSVKNVPLDEAVNVDLSGKLDALTSRASERKSVGQPQADLWVAVTTNDGQLVMRNQGAFKQFGVKDRLPNGEVLLSLNEKNGEYKTSNGMFQIKGSSQ